ncbi:hypothetical protein [Candidatus Solirubrobacter pratensis]|uniref:hypothetical protein n=1 Tax=Candidatus Solirubrobacter pratensis TaxID=1298857 RepID=UPI000428AA45|nr:hypothetical protein [Candidatus Solirubrobacter pratensis]
MTIAAPSSSPPVSTPRTAPLLVLAALALAALSLLLPWALAFDPSAWLVWGRDTLRLALDTSPGPSWKPLPVVLTTPFALLPGAAPALWMIVARAGGLLALAGAWALAERLAGRWAGFAAAATMALSPWWLFNTALGNSEGLLAASVVWALVAHLEGRTRTAVVLGTAAGLLRPEVWPFLGLYGLWLWFRDPAARPVLLGCGVLVPLLWFGPDAIGAGGALGASKAARGTPSPGSAGLESVPALALLRDTVDMVTWPALVAAALATILGPRAATGRGGDARTAGRTIRFLAAGAAGWVAIVALMTQAGYAGNPRYLVAAAAIACALAGVGAVSLARRTAPGGAPLGAAVLLAAVVAASLGTLRGQADQLTDRPKAAASFHDVVAAAGGREAIVRCGALRSGVGARSFVAWELDVPMRDLGARPSSPGVVIRARSFYGNALEPALAHGHRVLAQDFHWQVVSLGCSG